MTEKNVASPSDLPKTPHWAVLVYVYVTVPGYDKGDPDERKDVVEYIAFGDKKDLEAWIAVNNVSYSKKTFSVINVTPAKVKTTYTIAVE